MSEQGAPKPEKAAKKGGGDGAAKAEGGKKAQAPEGGKDAKKEKGGGKKDAGPKAGKEARDPNYVPRFKKRYFDVVRPELMQKFGYKNQLQAPRIEKIVLNIGAGEGAADQKKIQSAQNDLTAIAGQKAV